MLNSRSSSRSPFTATQWQELEHQALIYKYMVSGVPIPPELLYSVKRSLESSLATRFFPNQPMGWGCFQVGFGRKPDPEPGRCRRTDGKKWRCSKEAYPDSKYCEKHMHRGRNRSRKPVEPHQPQHQHQLGSSSANTNPTLASPSLISSPSSSPANNTITTTSASPSSSSYSFSPLSSTGSLEPDHHQNPAGNLMNPFLYTTTHSPASRPSGSGYSTQASTTHNLFMDASSGSSSHADKDYRYYQGIREGMDERAFFPSDASGRERSYQDSPYINVHPGLSSYRGHSSHFHCFGDAAPNKSLDDHHHQEVNHCFVLGTDFKSQQTPRPIIKPEKLDIADDTHKPMHHFFGDHEWPPKSTSSDSWLDLASSTTRTIHPDG